MTDQRGSESVGFTTATMHRHESLVDHAETDHNHGCCSDHAHWAGGTHLAGVSFESSTPENDPLGWS